MSIVLDFVNATFSQFSGDYACFVRDDTGQPVYLYLSVVQVQDENREATFEDFKPYTRVTLATRSNPTAGVIITLREPTTKLNLGLDWRFPKYRQLSHPSLHLHLLFGFFELAAAVKSPRMLQQALDAMGKIPSSNEVLPYTISLMQTLKRSFTLATAEMLADVMTSNTYAAFVVREIESLAQLYYGHNGGEWIYAKAREKQVRTEEWNLHALATVLNVILVEVTVDHNGTVYLYHYPNTTSPFVPVLYFTEISQQAVLLYPTEALNLRDAPGKYAEFIYKPNYLARMRMTHRLQNAFSESTSATTLANLKDFLYAEIGIGSRNTELETMAKVDWMLPNYPRTSQQMHVQDMIANSAEEAVAALTNIQSLLPRVDCCFCHSYASHFFPCNCGICEKCVLEELRRTETIHCENHGKVITSEELKPPVKEELLAQAFATFQRLECGVCRQTFERKDFPIKKKFKPAVYILDCGDFICVRCLEVSARRLTSQCPMCYQVINMHERELALMKETCWKCKGKNTVEKHFSSIICPDHRCCVKCLSQIIDIDNCRKCNRDYTAEERKVLEEIVSANCEECGNEVSLKEMWPRTKECTCALCYKCGLRWLCDTLNIESCPKCKKGHYPDYQMAQFYNEILRARIEDAKDMGDYLVSRAEIHRRTTCNICTEPITSVFERVTSADTCPHLFHRECLGDAIAAEITDIRGKQLKRRVKCPSNLCPVEIDPQHLTGGTAVISEEAYNQYQVYAINLDVVEFTCKRCKLLGFVDIDQTHFQCQCGYHQCLKCSGEWTPAHNDRVCQFYIIEAIVQNMENMPCECEKKRECEACMIGQCPGCKYPYFKDDHCDHVRCRKEGCGVEFCFRCCCVRKPTMEHSTQWHREQCKWYPHDLSPEKNKKVVNSEKIQKGCPECTRLGRRCDPPKNLKTPRRFTLEEFLAD